MRSKLSNDASLFTVQDLRDLLNMLPADLPTNLATRALPSTKICLSDKMKLFVFYDVRFSAIDEQEVRRHPSDSVFPAQRSCCLNNCGKTEVPLRDPLSGDSTLKISDLIREFMSSPEAQSTDPAGETAPLLYSTDYFMGLPQVIWNPQNVPVSLHFQPRPGELMLYFETQMNPFRSSYQVSHLVACVQENFLLLRDEDGFLKEMMEMAKSDKALRAIHHLCVIKVENHPPFLYDDFKRRFPHFARHLPRMSIRHALRSKSEWKPKHHFDLAVEDVKEFTDPSETFSVSLVRLHPQITVEFLQSWFSESLISVRPIEFVVEKNEAGQLIFTNQLT